MARKPDKENRKKRIRTIVLNKRAFEIYREIRIKSPYFDFSKWVSNRLILEFDNDPKSEVIRKELLMIQDERDRVNEDFEIKINGLAQKLQECKKKEDGKITIFK